MMLTNGKSHRHVTSEPKIHDVIVAVNADLQSGQRKASDVRVSAAETLGRLTRTDPNKMSGRMLE